ncbi:MAG: TIM barrel protein [Bacteroidetes bacterium]|jgi:hydroxypyruvate isomerase|nr:MAG: TIM barrel protein [Bacteroidota bacterium]
MKKSNRRDALKKIVAGTAAASVAPFISSFAAEETNSKKLKLKGNINHSVCQWTYNHIPLEELCVEVKKIGIGAIDLIAPKDWPMLKKYGLYSSMCYIAGKVSLTEGWNNKTFHPQLIKDFSETIPLVKEAGYKNLICFSGNRKGMDDETGMNNCVEGLKQIMGLAEKNGVMIQMELLNSKVDHKDYMCDKTPWGVELVKRIGSPNFKLLYDIYHMQIDEGDVIRSIQNYNEYIGHYHTAGVPGRHEINESQELFYPAIMEAIVKTGFKDYVAQEFVPTGKTNDEKIAALKDAVRRCDV